MNLGLYVPVRVAFDVSVFALNAFMICPVKDVLHS
jgi:hypothetical protein